MSSTRRHFIKAGLTGLATTGIANSGYSSEQKRLVERRRLGRVDKDVSILGLGLGRSFYKPWDKDREGAHVLLNAALDAGVNYWDTSHNYGGGVSEEIIAPVVKQRRDEIFLVSKSAQRDYDGFKRELEGSLERLGTDHIDLFHLHNLKPHDSVDEMEKGCFRALKEAKEQGLVGSYGVTGHSGVKILMDAIERFDPDALLTIFPCNRPDDGDYEDKLLPMARERSMGVVGMKTVKHARNADLKGSDLIRYALSLEGVHSVIVGLDTAGHLQENLAMAQNFEPLTPEQQLAMTQDAQTSLAGLIAPWDVPGYEDGGCSYS